MGQRLDDALAEWHEVAKGGIFYGPRGGKYADAAHTIPYSEPTAGGKPAAKPEAKPEAKPAHIIESKAAVRALTAAVKLHAPNSENAAAMVSHATAAHEHLRAGRHKDASTSLDAAKAAAMKTHPPLTSMAGYSLADMRTSIDRASQGVSKSISSALAEWRKSIA